MCIRDRLSGNWYNVGKSPKYEVRILAKYWLEKEESIEMGWLKAAYVCPDYYLLEHKVKLHAWP